MPNFDPTRQEMLDHFERNSFTDVNGYMRFDIEAAIWYFASQWHGGQWTNLYSALSTSPYRPSPLYKGPKPPDGEIVEMLVDELEAEFTPHD